MKNPDRIAAGRGAKVPVDRRMLRPGRFKERSTQSGGVRSRCRDRQYGDPQIRRHPWRGGGGPSSVTAYFGVHAPLGDAQAKTSGDCGAWILDKVSVLLNESCHSKPFCRTAITARAGAQPAADRRRGGAVALLFCTGARARYNVSLTVSCGPAPSALGLRAATLRRRSRTEPDLPNR